MPLFSFSDVKKKNTKSHKETQHTFIHKKVEGVVFIDDKGEYNVKYKNKHYIITPESYSCKGKLYVYNQRVNKPDRELYVRLTIEDLCKYTYLPFTVGCIVIGDIISKNNIEYFSINEVIVDKLNDESRDAIHYYKRNFNKIKKCLDERFKKFCYSE